jgi:hypothetical protein
VSSAVPDSMRYASPPERRGYHCAACKRFIVTALEGLFYNPDVGSPTRFCSSACRQAAYRRRRAGVAEDSPPQRTGGRNRHLAPPPS